MAGTFDGEIAVLKSLYPHVEMNGLTTQQERALVYWFRGAGLAAAAREAGYASDKQLRELLKREDVQLLIEYLKEKHFSDVRIDRDKLTVMLIEAHSRAATALEEIAAIRELGKLHGLYLSDKQQGTNVTVNNTQILNQVQNEKQLKNMTDQQLIELAGLDPGFVVDGEASPVDDDADAIEGYDKELDV